MTPRKDGRKLAKAWLRAVKDQSGCLNCGEDHPATLEFHHVDRREKRYNISEMVKTGMPVEMIEHEALKCVILCSNCHKKFHHNEKHDHIP